MLLLLLGVIRFVCSWANIHNVFRILPEQYAQRKWVILLISLAYILNLASGLSNQMILYSKFYRIHSVVMIVMIGLIVVLNVTLIPVLGITGAAIATASTYLAAGIFRWAFIWWRFGLQPFNYQHVLVVAAALLILFLSGFIPKLHLIPDIIVRTAFVGTGFLLFIKFTNVSPDFKKVVDRFIFWKK